jgi:hypothetical protein
MYVRGLTKALDHHDVRDLIEAEQFALKRGKLMTATITVHPKFLDEYPEDMGRWIGWLTNKIRIYCQRTGFGYFAMWVRENYESDDWREHLHLMLHLPESQRDALEDALRRWLPGAENAVHLGRPEFRRDRYGRKVNKALTYMLKQMTPQAHYALGGQVFREKQCRETHARVVPVLGRRSGVSRSLNARTRATFWVTPRKPSRTLAARMTKAIPAPRRPLARS